MTASVVSALVFGASGGLSPGPLLMLLLAETLRHGLRAGIMVAVAPLASDLPIIVVSVALLAQVADVAPVMGAISFAGAVLLLHLGIANLRYSALHDAPRATPGQALRRAVTVNFLNPNPYLFWLLLGAPTMIGAWQRGAAQAAAFVVVFYALLVGSKMLVALLVHRSRALLQGSAYVWIVRALGGLLIAFALKFAFDGAESFGWLG